MKKAANVLIFGGTTEGRKAAEFLDETEISGIVSVATEAGAEELENLGNIRVLVGRRDEQGIEKLIEEEKIGLIIDAAHPFAEELRKNIAAAAVNSGASLIRLKRGTSGGNGENSTYFSSTEECAEALREIDGNILLTTGSKTIKEYTDRLDADRLYVRILPVNASIDAVKEAGLRNEHIIAMQGVFSKEMNRALIREFNIKCLVTKETGENGGFPEKLQAADAEGIKSYIIADPDESEGVSFAVLKKMLKEEYGISRKSEVVLIGMGSGDPDQLGSAACEALKTADFVIGAGRLIEAVSGRFQKIKEYDPEKILNIILKRNPGERTVVLYSGDTGFYSGASGLIKLLSKEGIKYRILPGLSSIQLLSARSGIAWDDAKIVSIHGRDADFTGAVKENSKVFMLLNNASDVRNIAEELISDGVYNAEIVIGIRLGYPDEKVVRADISECAGMSLEGIACCFILNKKTYSEVITPGRSDEAFVRGNVPMTKKAVRELSVCALKLRRDSVLWDIGAGTGSISVETALLSRNIKVVAVERNQEAIELIKENCVKAGLHNVEVVEGEAPEALKELECPTHVFIGGSGGHLREILNLLTGFGKRIRVVINAVSLETISETKEVLDTVEHTDESVVLAQISTASKAGNYRLMRAENPVYVVSFEIGGYKCIIQE
ncbi:MAG: precorrin-6A reductase [Lachnospiraceae bacterium]|nr:precorrin-6A reductase [Lachnospiraceae bacterium]